ncbi:MAG: hypothetical protein GF311_02895 [Candidatus Lokiarchaeota archaeon]|nr:hypothetical protein [Candidatus Lokiarchaeota archaeon]
MNTKSQITLKFGKLDFILSILAVIFLISSLISWFSSTLSWNQFIFHLIFTLGLLLGYFGEIAVQFVSFLMFGCYLLIYSVHYRIYILEDPFTLAFFAFSGIYDHYLLLFILPLILATYLGAFVYHDYRMLFYTFTASLVYCAISSIFGVFEFSNQFSEGSLELIDYLGIGIQYYIAQIVLFITVYGLISGGTYLLRDKLSLFYDGGGGKGE